MPFTLATAVAVHALAINVVTTTEDLASIAKDIGGSRVTVSSLVTGARDPHRIEPKPSFISRVAQAKLFIAVGLDLELGYESAVLQGSRNANVQVGRAGHLYASDGCKLLDVRGSTVSRSEGDIHPRGNPHVWLDPLNARQIAWNIRAALMRVDPAGAAAYERNALAFLDRLDRAMFGSPAVDRFGTSKLWTWSNEGTLAANAPNLGGWAAKMEPHRGSSVIVYHRSWTYFLNRFGLKCPIELEPKPGIEPTPSHLTRVVQVAKSQGVRRILLEPFYSVSSANFVAQRSGAKVLVVASSVGQTPAAKDYLSMIGSAVQQVSGS
jgi:ABC-type Zn uptake system ZnuABC Zn-binding protein ZnuA